MHRFATLARLAVTVSGLVMPRTSPTVDLGYAIHGGHLEPGDVIGFPNIRYADPPVGTLRFAAPQRPSFMERDLNDGSHGSKCPQAWPSWSLGENAREAGSPREVMEARLADPTMSEDCLFLDVSVPKAVWEKHHGQDETGQTVDLAPVMVWIHGGGFVFGAKDDDAYNPSGLIARSRSDGSDGVVFVSINYRLGLFGWLNNGPGSIIHPNAGLHDQRLALEWVKEYIHLFGGDPDRVTVMGQSAGAAGIMHHLTAEGGSLPAPFSQAIVQSPGWQTTINPPLICEIVRTMAHALLGLRPEEIVSETTLRSMDEVDIIRLNADVVFNSPPGGFTFGPSVDGAYVPDMPGRLLLSNQFDSTPKLMTGHNRHEAGLFIPEREYSADEASAIMAAQLPSSSPETIAFVLGVLYPSPASDTPYTTEHERAVLFASELSFSCNTRYLGTAFDNATFSYIFDVPPAVHHQDIPWTFYNGNGEDPVGELAKSMQGFFTSFAKTGSPVGQYGGQAWTEYGDEATVAVFGSNGVSFEIDDVKNTRCDYWQTGGYLSQVGDEH